MKNKFNKLIVILACILASIMLSSCKKQEPVPDNNAVDVAEQFYTKYLQALKASGPSLETELSDIKTKYLSPLLVEEMEYRSRELDADAYLNTQDSYGMLEIMKVSPGSNENEAVVNFLRTYDYGGGSNTDFTITVKEDNGKFLINGIDCFSLQKDEKGNTSVIEYKTKYANKDVLTEDDKKELESLKAYYEELDDQGYIS